MCYLIRTTRVLSTAGAARAGTCLKPARVQSAGSRLIFPLMTAARTSTELPRAQLRVRATALRLPGLVISILLVAVALQHGVAARVLEQDDLTRIARMNTLFLEVLTDVSQSAQRTDLASGDSECVRSTLRALTQIAEELRSYSYLMTIEGELTGDDHTLRGVVRFAVENALQVSRQRAQAHGRAVGAMRPLSAVGR